MNCSECGGEARFDVDMGEFVHVDGLKDAYHFVNLSKPTPLEVTDHLFDVEVTEDPAGTYDLAPCGRCKGVGGWVEPDPAFAHPTEQQPMDVSCPDCEGTGDMGRTERMLMIYASLPAGVPWYRITKHERGKFCHCYSCKARCEICARWKEK